MSNQENFPSKRVRETLCGISHSRTKGLALCCKGYSQSKLSRLEEWRSSAGCKRKRLGAQHLGLASGPSMASIAVRFGAKSTYGRAPKFSSRVHGQRQR